MVPTIDFDKIHSEFSRLESRGSFYDMAMNLIKNKFEIEAYLLILSTWNFAYFRYVVKNFDINLFRKTFDELEITFKKLNKKQFRSIHFDEFAEDIKKIYSKLSNLEGIKYTGASKILHLRCPNVFVMWDGFIKGEKKKRYYQNLKIVKNGFWEIKRYGSEADDYLQFLKDMQIKFRDAKPSKNNHFTKSIDEFNFINITLPIQEMISNEKKGRD